MTAGTIGAGDLNLTKNGLAVYDVSADRSDQPITVAPGLRGHRIADPGTWQIVPGDTVAVAMDATVTLRGDNLVARLSLGAGGCVEQAFLKAGYTVYGDQDADGTFDANEVLATGDRAPVTGALAYLEASRAGQAAGGSDAGPGVAYVGDDGTLDLRIVLTETFNGADTAHQRAAQNLGELTVSLAQVRTKPGASFTAGASGAAGGLVDGVWGPDVVPEFPVWRGEDAIAESWRGGVELGAQMSSSVPGWVCGVEFYKGEENLGEHVGHVWAIDGGAPLATATFTEETATGWQTVYFDEPVRIDAGKEFIVSYWTPSLHYSATPRALAEEMVVGQFTVPYDAGMFAYGEAVGRGDFDYGFPGRRWSSSYMVDVVFSPDMSGVAAP